MFYFCFRLKIEHFAQTIMFEKEAWLIILT